MENIFFSSWESVFRSLVLTVLAYIAIVALLRVMGKRTLSKMNAFDFIITVALGSALANVALNKDLSLLDGVVVFFLFMGLQYLITWLSVRFPFIKDLVTDRPVILLYKGELYDEILKRERITLNELEMVARQKGIGKLEDIDVIILETTGKLTVIGKLDAEDTLRNVIRPIKN